MSSNKLDYLAKYMEDRGGEKTKSKKKRRKRKQDEVILCHDEEPDVDVLIDNNNNNNSPQEEMYDAGDVDDGPVLVNDIPDGVVQKNAIRCEGGDVAERDEYFKEDRPRCRKRHDSDVSNQSSSSSAGNKGPNRRRDTSEEESENSRLQPRRRRHDSPDTDEESDSNDDDRGERMSSGHRAGLQNGEQFSQKEAKLQRSRRIETADMVDKYGFGETVYRDKKSGARITTDDDVKSDHHRKQQLMAQEQLLLNTGKVQLQQHEQQQVEFEHIQQSTFARRVDDTELEQERKREIRVDDPMAAYASKKLQQSNSAQGLPTRPVYKGPPPKPNRYNIRPGHRWDARDRGNGFEEKVLAQRYSVQHKQEQAYRYSAADM